MKNRTFVFRTTSGQVLESSPCPSLTKFLLNCAKNTFLRVLALACNGCIKINNMSAEANCKRCVKFLIRQGSLLILTMLQGQKFGFAIINTLLAERAKRASVEQFLQNLHLSNPKHRHTTGCGGQGTWHISKAKSVRAGCLENMDDKVVHFSNAGTSQFLFKLMHKQKPWSKFSFSTGRETAILVIRNTHFFLQSMSGDLFVHQKHNILPFTRADKHAQVVLAGRAGC